MSRESDEPSATCNATQQPDLILPRFRFDLTEAVVEVWSLDREVVEPSRSSRK